MTDHFQEIYAHHADRYEQLIVREDYQGHILPALHHIRPLARLDVVEMGAGTGRLTALLAPLVNHIRAFDRAPAMLDVAMAKLEKMGLENWSVEVADNKALPVEDGEADVSIAGWSFGHSTAWAGKGWRHEIDQAVKEMQRVLRPGGTAIILETLGTGFETPRPPNRALADYYAFLENDLNFAATWIRTDYRFESLAEAETLTRFFFGDELAKQVTAHQWIILPECTGIWWWTKSA